MGNKNSRRQQQAAGSSPGNRDQDISNRDQYRDHYSNYNNASAPAITNPSHYHIDVESIPVAYPVTSGPEIQAMPLNAMSTSNNTNNNRVDSSWDDVARMIQSSNAEHNQRQQHSKQIIRR